MLNLFDDNQPLTLSMLNSLVRETIENYLPDSFWLQAELASVRESRGHCYMELVEKSEDAGTIKAQARACCWKNTWMKVGNRFAKETGMPLHSGITVLLNVHANFHEAFGFSWIVEDIDPTFTLGDMARKRKKIIRQLTEEGVIDLNKQLPISPFCKRIAVISSATAAGYGDFCNQLSDNSYGFKFETHLFPAVMQGELVESSIIEALNKIYSSPYDCFDCVVIIRGGGSTTDLSGFDTLMLAEHVANFPLPIITGIGHDRDQSILDIVACVSVKTPTAVAEFLIDNLATTLEKLDSYTLHIVNVVQRRLERENMRLQRVEQKLDNVFNVRRILEENKLKSIFENIYNIAEKQLLIENNKIRLMEQNVRNLDPVVILKKGYSIVLHNGVTVKDSSILSEGEELTIMFAKGQTNAVVSSASSFPT